MVLGAVAGADLGRRGVEGEKSELMPRLIDRRGRHKKKCAETRLVRLKFADTALALPLSGLSSLKGN